MPLRIAFILRSPSFHAPEIQAYTRFFARYGVACQVFYQNDAKLLRGYDIEWRLMGLDTAPRQSGRMKIHEYASLSSPPFGRWKDRIKKVANVQPDLRIFLSPTVKKLSQMGDDVPFVFRDMGVAPEFFAPCPEGEKTYDLVYSGNLDAERRPRTYIRALYRHWPECRLLLLGSISEGLRSWLRRYPLAHAQGRVPYWQVPGYLCQARFGLNLIPDVYPLNVQTSTKLLEYCAAGLPVASTPYAWLSAFERETGARFFILSKTLDNLKPEALGAFGHRLPSLQGRTWDTVITHSGILRQIGAFFGEAFPTLPPGPDTL
ncbi:MAG: hypothetical protein KDC66_22135 [Phaeodactylibacter sp.]|nr:hypothetical protein [Phaeodactylibacter sp.]MCB9276491.1 hypothetical protein [Lewinellaceae bacterium]